MPYKDREKRNECARRNRKKRRETDPEAVRQADRERYAATREARQAYDRQYRQANLERRREVEAAYRARNPEQQRARHERYRQENAKKRRAYDREYAEANRDKAVTRTRRWQKKNPEVVRLAVKRRAVQKKGVLVVAFSPEELVQRMAMFPGCWLCGGPKEAADHVKPLVQGGAHILANLRPACTSCNSSKNGRWPVPTAFSRPRLRLP